MRSASISFSMIFLSLVVGVVSSFSVASAQTTDPAKIKRQQQEFLRLRKKIDREVERQIEADKRAWELKQAREPQYSFDRIPAGPDYIASREQMSRLQSTPPAPSAPTQPVTPQYSPPPQVPPTTTATSPVVATLPAPLPAPVEPPPAPLLTAPLRQIDQTVVDRNGTLRIMNRMTCDPGLSICQQICQSTACEWPEPQCRDCFGTGSEVMRDVFVRLSASYRVIRTINDASLIESLMARSMVLVSQKSPYDFFNSSADPGISPHLSAMCGSTNGFVAVVLDNDGRPSRAVLAICSTESGVNAALIERSDERTADPHSEVLQPIRLKLATDLMAIPKP